MFPKEEGSRLGEKRQSLWTVKREAVKEDILFHRPNGENDGKEKGSSLQGETPRCGEEKPDDLRWRPGEGKEGGGFSKEEGSSLPATQKKIPGILMDELGGEKTGGSRRPSSR